MITNPIDPTSALREAAQCLHLAMDQFYDAGTHPMQPAVARVELLVKDALAQLQEILHSATTVPCLDVRQKLACSAQTKASAMLVALGNIK